MIFDKQKSLQDNIAVDRPTPRCVHYTLFSSQGGQRMTVIIGADYNSEILVVADTRVSFGKKHNIPPKDQLVKLVSIQFFQRQAVLGFSGNIPFAKYVIELLGIHAQVSKSCGDLKEDLRGWIENAIRMKRPRYHLEFMLCDFDPTEEAHIYVYDIREDGKVLLQPQGIVNVIDSGGRPGRGKVAIIGSGRELKERVYEATLNSVGNPEQYDSYEAYSNVRALMAVTVIDHEFRTINSQDVGGPFTVIRLRPKTLIGPHYLWPLDDKGTSDIRQTQDGKCTILSRPSTGETYTLYKIFDYTGADFAQCPEVMASSTI